MNNYQIGDIVTMKKNHPCGANEWEIFRTGVDFKLRCCACDRLIMIPRQKFLKNVRKTIKSVKNQEKADE